MPSFQLAVGGPPVGKAACLQLERLLQAPIPPSPAPGPSAPDAPVETKREVQGADLGRQSRESNLQADPSRGETPQTGEALV